MCELGGPRSDSGSESGLEYGFGPTTLETFSVRAQRDMAQYWDGTCPKMSISTA